MRGGTQNGQSGQEFAGLHGQIALEGGVGASVLGVQAIRSRALGVGF
jgi:hypothetical protein